MSRESTLILLGILVVLAPFIGLPYSWLGVLLPVLGLLVILLAVALRAKRLTRSEHYSSIADVHESTTS